MSRTAGILSIAALVSAILVGGGKCYATIITVPDDQPTIQAAIDAAVAGDTIEVNAGVYPDTITVNKSLTIRGPQAGVDARTRVTTDAQEAIIILETAGVSPDYGFNITAPNVTIDGFTFRFSGTGTTARGIDVSGGVGGIVVRNNRFLTTHDGVNVVAGTTGLLVERNLFTDSVSKGVDIDDAQAASSSNVTIQDNVFQSNGGIDIYSTTGVVIQRNALIGSTASAIIVNGGANVLIQENLISGTTGGPNGIGILGTVNGLQILSNTLINNQRGVNLSGTLTGTVVISFNRFVGNTEKALRNTIAGYTVPAENNWWGSNDAPLTTGVNSASSASDYTPWLVLGLSASPNPLPAGGTTVLSADLTVNSDGVDTSALGSVMDGTEITFGTDSGSVNPTVAATIDGVATSSLTVAATPATASATLDAETVTTLVDVSGTSVNTPPDAVDDAATTEQDLAVTVDVLANDTDADGNPLTLVSFTQGAHGTVSAVAGGLLYVPNGGYVGPDSFTYTINDGQGGADTATVSITVVPGFLEAPSNLVATAVAWNRIDLSWTDNSSTEEGFLIQRSTDGVNFTTIATVGAGVTSYSDVQKKGFEPRAYTYRVQAYRVTVRSDYSNTATAVAPYHPPVITESNLTLYVQGNNGVVEVKGNNNIIYVYGTATTLNVKGNKNVIYVQSVQRVEVNGNNNTVYYDTGGPTTSLNGNKNTVTLEDWIS